MPSFRHHDYGNLYIQFEVKFPSRLNGPDGESSMTPEQVKALESVLPPRIPGRLPPPDAMQDEYQVEDVDPTREGGAARAMNAMDEDDDDMHPGAERVQCASQ